MKKIISLRLAAITLIAFICITSCSKNDDTNGLNENAKVTSFLKSFYGKKIKNGTSIDAKVKMTNSTTTKSEEFGDIVVTEVFVGDETRARGYTITSKETNVFLYFVDVDRIEYKMTTVDIEANQTLIVDNIDELDKYVATNQFDFIKITQDLIDQNGQAGTLSKTRYSYGSCVNGVRGVYQATFFLWIQWTNWEPVMVPNSAGTGLTHATVGCNEKYHLDTSID